MARIHLVIALASLSACSGRPPPPPPPPPLDTVLGPGQVRCGAVTKESELIGGPAAFGQVGRSYRCHNANIRFLIQDATRPVGISAEGGNLIDIDLVRPDEAAEGKDAFREHVSAIGAREIKVDKIEVLNDGSDGVHGIIRVSGTPTDLTLAPQAHFLAQAISGVLFTDYILRPDVAYVEIVTTLQNDGLLLPAVQAADFVGFGGAVRAHTPEFGYGDVEIFSQVSLLSAARNDFTSYAVVSGEGPIRIPFIDQGITAPFYGDNVAISSERPFFRWLVVGDGSLESTTKVALALQELPRGTVRGVVMVDTGASEAPAVGLLVSALSAPLPTTDEEGGAHIVNEARTAADGSYSLTLTPGEYTLLAHGTGFQRSGESSVAVDDGAEVTADVLRVGGPGTVRVTTSFVDATGADLGTRPAKLTLVPVATTQRASRILADFEAGGAVAYQVTSDGAFSLAVPAGAYTAYVTRGFEWTRSQRDVVVVSGETSDLAAQIAHVMDTAGLIGAEFHQHTLGSIDAAVPIATKVMENAAEGIELAASTDHDVVTDFQPHVDALGLTAFLSVIAGSEVSYQGVGHFNAYPWAYDDADPFAGNGSRFWWRKTIPEMFAGIRAAAGDPILQINHPRSSPNGYFQSLLLNAVDASRAPRASTAPTLPPTIYQDWAGDFDAVEVNANLGDVSLFTADRAALLDVVTNDPSAVPVLADYFALLGAGMKVIAMGNSDTHQLDEGVGYPRNFLEVATNDPAAVTGDMMKEAIRAQRSSVGEGCLLELFVQGARSSGVARMITAAALDDVSVRLQAPPHVTPGVFELYVNGVARRYGADASSLVLDEATGALSMAVSSFARADAIVRMDHGIAGLPSNEGDLVVVALSKGGTGLPPTGGGAALCYSAPLYVDIDGDGAFTGWLAQTQQVLR